MRRDPRYARGPHLHLYATAALTASDANKDLHAVYNDLSPFIAQKRSTGSKLETS
jgi:hypothetical protein